MATSSQIIRDDAVQACRPTPQEAEIQPTRLVVLNFLEGTRVIQEQELRDNNITRYQVTRFYRQQIESSGYYEQLKHIVEPSLQEFQSPGSLDTSGECENTVVHGLQHKYRQTGLL